MKNFAWLSEADNKCTAATTVVTASSEAIGYPASNLVYGKPWRSTGVSSEYLEFDFGSALAIKLCIVRNHNLSSGATITIKGGASANPSTFTDTITWRKGDAFKIFTATQTYRYWRLAIADTGNAYGFIQLAPPMLGSHTQPSIMFRHEWSKEREWTNRRMETSFYVPNVEQVASRYRLKHQFGPMTPANMVTLTDLFDTLDKNVTPIFWIPDTSAVDGYYGRLDRDPVLLYAQGYQSLAVEFVEDGRGNLIAL